MHASNFNWAAPIICVALSAYVLLPLSPLALVAWVIVFLIPVIASVVTVKFTQLKNWGLIFILGWILGLLILAVLIKTIFGSH
jgi:hypothetical protein